MYLDAIVAVSVVVVVQVHMVIVHMGDNTVLHAQKSIYGALSSPAQAPTIYFPLERSWRKCLLLILDNFTGGGGQS